MYLLTFLGFITAFFSTLLYLPPFSWLQIPLAVIATALANLIFIWIILGNKTKPKYFLIIILGGTLLNFYISNWVSYPDNASGEHAILVSTNSQGILIESKEFTLVDPVINDLGQAFGKIALSRYRNSSGVSFAIAYLESEKLISAGGWAKNRILFRRLGAKLRQLNEPILVIFNCSIPAGSELLNQFMFQARLDVKASLSPWKSLVGLKAPILLGRDVNFTNDSDKGLRFIFKY